MASLHEGNICNLMNSIGIYDGKCKDISRAKKKLEENEMICLKEVPTNLIFKRKGLIDVQMRILKDLNNYYLPSKEKEKVVKALPEMINVDNLLCDFVIFHKKNDKIETTIIELNGGQHYENTNCVELSEQISRDMAKVVVSEEEGISILIFKLTSDCEFSPVKDIIIEYINNKRGA